MAPRIIPRTEWGAAHDDGAGVAPLPAREVWLHHSVTVAPPAAASQAADADAVRVLERIGENRFGRGISYTFAVTPSGRIFQGHGIGRLGAHTGGRNSVSRAICLIGNYDVATPTGAQLDAVAWLLREGKTRGWWPAARLNGGHRDAPGASTACPGRHAHAAIGEINERAAARPDVLEDDMPLTTADMQAIRTAVREEVRAMLAEPVKRGGDGQTGTTSVATVAAWSDAAWTLSRAQVNDVRKLVQQLLDRPPLVLDEHVVRAAVTAALGGGLDIVGTATPKGAHS